jgi:hypothetical protein
MRSGSQALTSHSLSGSIYAHIPQTYHQSSIPFVKDGFTLIISKVYSVKLMMGLSNIWKKTAIAMGSGSQALTSHNMSGLIYAHTSQTYREIKYTIDH